MQAFLLALFFGACPPGVLRALGFAFEDLCREVSTLTRSFVLPWAPALNLSPAHSGKPLRGGEEDSSLEAKEFLEVEEMSA